MSIQTLNLTPALYSYYQTHAFREPPILSELREESIRQKGALANIQISPEQGQFMYWLVKAAKVKKILEIGTFLGYSSLWLALALPQGGKLTTCDINKEFADEAARYWRKAGVNHLIEFKEGPALKSLEELTGNLMVFDFIFMDADKIEYDAYYEYSLRLLNPGGIIAIDNTLRGGSVADPHNSNPSTVAMRKFNDKIIQDDRIEMSLLPMSDGITLVYKR